VSLLRPRPAWRAELEAQARQPPARARLPLDWQGHRIGSVEPELFERAGLVGSAWIRRTADGWCVAGADLTESLAHVAQALRSAGLAHVWRDEALGVRDAAGRLLGGVERAVVRPLGIATHAVHLVATDPQGRHWVQQRAMSKPNNPGLWDTLVGGMVPASDTLEVALARETWEEAGLRMEQLQALRAGGHVELRAPARDVPLGYVVERLDWFACILPPGIVPENQDGEVAQFAAMDAAEVTRRMEAGEFCPDAALILLQAFGAPMPE
jgi:8-oxo-dGTP pyrophosphatase MutT (NUDIX family)